MCGFIGRITPQPGQLPGRRPLRDGLRFLGRRGPDSAKSWLSEDGRVELLHARLAIVDTDPRAHQPLTDAAHSVTVMFVGEIYNYREIRSRLSQYPFQTSSDTEVILASYILEGLDGLNHLRGMYTICIVDARTHRVFLVRDPVGKKPLFVARWGGDLLFGSSILALAAAHGRAVALNADLQDFYWTEGFVDPQASVFCGVKPVLPGQVIELDWNGQQVGSRRHAPPPVLLYSGEPAEAAIENTGHLLRAAVERRLENNPGPAVLLSGGIDSTVVTAVASEVCRERRLNLQVLTLGSMLPLGNDEFYARYAARRLRVPLKIVRPSFRNLGQSILHCINLQDEPLGMPSFFPLERLVATVAPFSRVLLSGDGGDEVFLGYGKPGDWLSQTPASQVEDSVPCGPALPEWMSVWGRSMASSHLLGHGFTKVDRATAEQAVEMRCPLLDWDLIAYARSLPHPILTDRGKTKAMVKRQLRGWPNWFLERPKLGFALNLRWLWSLSNFAALRDSINAETVALFGDKVPSVLRKPANTWTRFDIFKNFQAAWRLLAWSQFTGRVCEATRAPSLT